MELYLIVMHQRNMDGDVDTERDLAELVEAGVLVKVERCVHGRLEPHWVVAYVQPDAPEMGGSTTRCPGSPTLVEVDDE